MFGFHGLELLVILIVAAVILGPKRLPEVGGALGRGLRDFRHSLKKVQEETGVAELKGHVRDMRETVLSVPRELEASTRPNGVSAGSGPGTTATGKTDSAGSGS